ncbi:MAG: OmpA family protein [Alistipes sp.]|nr:OmpA family protein [Candidatus Alistipes equi]
MKKFLFSLVAGLMLCAPVANAQENCGGSCCPKSAPYLFVGVQGGAQTTFTNADNMKLIMPYGGIYFGGYYNNVVGARIHGSGYRAKGSVKELGQNYYYNYYTADADLLFNISNLFWNKNCHFVNLVLIGGVGLNYAWHNNDFNAIATANPSIAGINNLTAWPSSTLGHNFRAGVQLDFNIARHFGVNLEVTANNMSDKFNSKYSNKNDWMLNAGIGLTYKFAYKKKAPAPLPAPKPAPAPAPKPAPAPAPAPKPAPAPAPKPEPAPVVKEIKENIFYNIRSSAVTKTEMEKVERVAKFLKENPTATAEIVGYADVKTGNPTINLKYSQQRAKDLKNILISKYGIDASRVTSSAKGDTVQPFAENEKNRVSIVTGTTKK